VYAIVLEINRPGTVIPAGRVSENRHIKPIYPLDITGNKNGALKKIPRESSEGRNAYDFHELEKIAHHHLSSKRDWHGNCSIVATQERYEKGAQS
jgi:hypothetical protein